MVWCGVAYDVRVGQRGGVAEDVSSHSSDGREEELDVTASQQLGVHAVGLKGVEWEGSEGREGREGKGREGKERKCKELEILKEGNKKR